MDLLISFILFMTGMVLCLTTGLSMILALTLGLFVFSFVAHRRGFAIGKVLRMAAKGADESMVVVLILALVGCLTALWRQSGTIAYFTYYGIKLIPPQIFILSAFVLSAIMSYLLGTSFGVTGTIGVILMTIARASGISAVVTGGAVLSGVYFGDRGSPAASSASLVANETHTNVNENIRRMLKSSLLPMLICAIFYALLSIPNQASNVDTTLLTRFEGEFRLSLICLLPAVLLLVLAFAGMKIKYVMMIDIVVSIILTAVTQKTGIFEILRVMVAGFKPNDAALSSILSGGGMVSMLEVALLLLLSSACAGIFEGTRMLGQVEGALAKLSQKIGRFPAMIVTSIFSCAIFCNQTIGIIMCRQCMQRNYPDSAAGREELMLDIENSVVVIAGLVPWCIASSVPLKMLGCDLRSLPFAAYLYLLPLCWLLRERFLKKSSHAAQNVL